MSGKENKPKDENKKRRNESVKQRVKNGSEKTLDIMEQGIKRESEKVEGVLNTDVKKASKAVKDFEEGVKDGIKKEKKRIRGERQRVP